jgi:hypothetical protein
MAFFLYSINAESELFMDKRNTIKWRKPIFLGVITYLFFAAAMFVRVEFDRYAVVPVSQDDWPDVVASLSAKAKSKGYSISPKSVYLDKGAGAYFIEYSFSNELLPFLIEELDLAELEPKSTKKLSAYKWPAKVLRQFGVSVEGSRMFLSQNIASGNDGDFICLLNANQTNLLRYVYND